MKNTFLCIFFTFFLNTNLAFGDDSADWLKEEIDKILISYQNVDLPNENRFLMIELKTKPQKPEILTESEISLLKI